MSATTNHELTNELIDFLGGYYRDEIGTLAQHYPEEQRSLEISFNDLYTFDADLAYDWLEQPEQIREYAEEALRLYDLPADIKLTRAHVRLGDVPGDTTYYPGEYSPTDRAGQYLGIRGEISKASDVYSRITNAAFECQRCGTTSHIPQIDADFQEPHECQGCERQGPFNIDFDQSDFVDAQLLRVQTPPEIATGAGQNIDVSVEDDLVDRVTVGDRVMISGTLHIEQKTSGRKKTGKFEPYVDGEHIGIEDSDRTDIDIEPDEQAEITRLTTGEDDDPLELAAASLAPKIYGLDHIKRMAILAMVGGSRVVYPSGDADRGDFHMLLLGDPGTGKSKIVDRVEQVAPRSVGVSGKGATIAGTTATADRDDFGDEGWTLKAGAFVKANGGIVCIDELDDMPSDVRAAMLEPMSKQSIHITKAGINAHLSTQTCVVAGANPKYGRFDRYEPVEDQFDFDSALLSRFDLIYTLTDQPDPEQDDKITGHILDAREAAKKTDRGVELTEAEEGTVDTPVSEDLLRKWVALAKRQPAPTYESEDVKLKLRDNFTTLRGANGYDQDSPVPTTFRKLEGIVRIAEAAAKFEFSEVITERHVAIATKHVGQSMRDYGRDEEGTLDVDVQETGSSKTRKDQLKLIESTIKSIAEDGGAAYRPDVVDELADEIGEKKVEDLLEKALRRGWATEPRSDYIRWIGRYS